MTTIRHTSSGRFIFHSRGTSTMLSILRGHPTANCSSRVALITRSLYGISRSVLSRFVITGSFVSLLVVSSLYPQATLRGHMGHVRGVSWDPTGRYIASQVDLIVLVASRYQKVDALKNVGKRPNGSHLGHRYVDFT